MIFQAHSKYYGNFATAMMSSIPPVIANDWLCLNKQHLTLSSVGSLIGSGKAGGEGAVNLYVHTK